MTQKLKDVKNMQYTYFSIPYFIFYWGRMEIISFRITIRDHKYFKIRLYVFHFFFLFFTKL